MSECFIECKRGIVKMVIVFSILIISLAVAYFLCSRANIGRYQYHSYSKARADQYVLDTKEGILYQSVCGKYENDDCQYTILQAMPILSYNKMQQIFNQK